MADSAATDPETLERDLDATRSRLDEDLSRLQERLSPGQVLDDVLGYFRGSDGADFGRRLLDTARANPMPVALTGIGLAWLIASRPTAAQASAPTSNGVSAPDFVAGEGDADYVATMIVVREAEAGVTRGPDEDETSFASRLDDARAKAMGLTRDVQETAETFGQRIKDAIAAAEQAIAKAGEQIGAARSRAGATMDSARQTAQDAARQAGDYASRTLDQSREAGARLVARVTDDPVLLGAVGVAAGALLAALLPVTDPEEAALAGAAGQARETAKALARESLERGKHVADAIVEHGRDSAAAHGLSGGRTPGELVDAALSGDLGHDARAVAQDVLRAGEEAVRRQAAEAAGGGAHPAGVGG